MVGSKGKCRGFLHCGADGEAVRRFGRNDDSVGGRFCWWVGAEQAEAEAKAGPPPAAKDDNLKTRTKATPTASADPPFAFAQGRLFGVRTKKHGNGKRKGKCGDFSTARRTVRLSVASVEMTKLGGGLDEDRRRQRQSRRNPNSPISARPQSYAMGCQSSTRFPSGSVHQPNFPKS